MSGKNGNNNNNNNNDSWETVVPASKKQNNKRRPRSRWTAPVQVEYIPPTPANSSFEQCLILLVGIPGSGKSTFSRALEEGMPYKFARINQDELKNRQQCEAKCKEMLASGMSPIIDRCNFDAQQRRTWYNLAQSAGIPVDCWVLQVDRNECIRRCEARTNHETVSPKEARRIVGIVQGKLKSPHPNETNFRSLQTIRDGDEFNDAILLCLNQK